MMRIVLFVDLTLEAATTCHGVDLRPYGPVNTRRAAIYIPTDDAAERTAAERRMGLLRAHLSYIVYRLGKSQDLLKTVSFTSEGEVSVGAFGETVPFEELARHLPAGLEPAGVTLAFFGRYLESDDPKWRSSMLYQAFSAIYGGPEALVSQVATLSSEESVAAILGYTHAIRLHEGSEGEVEPEPPPEEVFKTLEKVYLRSISIHHPELM